MRPNGAYSTLRTSRHVGNSFLQTGSKQQPPKWSNNGPIETKQKVCSLQQVAAYHAQSRVVLVRVPSPSAVGIGAVGGVDDLLLWQSVRRFPNVHRGMPSDELPVDIDGRRLLSRNSIARGVDAGCSYVEICNQPDLASCYCMDPSWTLVREIPTNSTSNATSCR